MKTTPPIIIGLTEVNRIDPIKIRWKNNFSIEFLVS